MTNQELIDRAASVLETRKTKGGLLGHVGSALITYDDQVYVGICADVGTGTLCAERNAIGSMITDGEHKIRKIVAVWKDSDGNVFVIVPCGDCRRFICEVSEKNLDTEVILGPTKTVPVRLLLPNCN